MNKIFKLFSVLTVLLLVMGLSSCIIIDAGSDPEDFGNIDNEADFIKFMKNGSKFAKLTAQFDTYSEAVIPAGKEKTLDLNGCKVTFKRQVQESSVVSVLGTLTLNDTHSAELDEQGGFVNENSDGIAIYVEGTVNINAGQYEVEHDGYGLFVAPGATSTVSKAFFDGGICVGVAGTVEELKCDTTTDNVAVVVSNGGRIKKLSSFEDYYTVFSNVDNEIVFGLINNGTIDEIKDARFNVQGMKNPVGLYNNGTIGAFTGANEFYSALRSGGSGDALNLWVSGATNPSDCSTNVDFDPAYAVHTAIAQ